MQIDRLILTVGAMIGAAAFAEPPGKSIPSSARRTTEEFMFVAKLIG